MKILSWNVNGLRAILKKDFEEQIKKLSPDIICLQETKLDHRQVDIALEGYESFWESSTAKKGYSGVAIFTKVAPLDVIYGIGNEQIDQEGRVLTLEFEEFYLVNVYVPNSQYKLARIDFRLKYEDEIKKYLNILAQNKSVVMCGDLNVAANEIDLYAPEKNKGECGFSDQERQKFKELIDSGFVDSYRYLYPDKKDEYSWWSYISKARTRNEGWRIDYFIVSTDAKEYIIDSKILMQEMRSDHCPIMLDIDLA